MQKDSFTVWLITHKMFSPQKQEGQQVEPAYFENITGTDTILDFFNIAKYQKLINLDVDPEDCMYVVRMIPRTVCNKLQARTRNRLSMYLGNAREVLKSTAIDINLSSYYLDLSLTVRQIIEKEFPNFSALRFDEFQLRIYLYWCEVTFQLENQDRQITFLRKSQQNFNCLYLKAIAAIPEMKDNLYKISFKYGPRINQYYFTERVIFTNPEMDTQCESQMKQESKPVTVPPNAQIFMENGIYDFKEI